MGYMGPTPMTFGLLSTYRRLHIISIEAERYDEALLMRNLVKQSAKDMEVTNRKEATK
ncbi:hypothetical protein BDP81DRAFT_420867 [Colletotrichum phormii]|uniref:Uncharacterized protein n=1 Tax=Colletotrichum phormii TaxID=359342 RepID=A0AAI9ZW93_9PEZI|nr:uncharacterized protein BDP81DRAFT_420867 [Colletotrichum phormii]KAK1639380.1 hypothetical protein BDP81DRAFT_420867 [Colletotrichum phormii]